MRLKNSVDSSIQSSVAKPFISHQHRFSDPHYKSTRTVNIPQRGGNTDTALLRAVYKEVFFVFILTPRRDLFVCRCVFNWRSYTCEDTFFLEIKKYTFLTAPTENKGLGLGIYFSYLGFVWGVKACIVYSYGDTFCKKYFWAGLCPLPSQWKGILRFRK